MLDFLQEAFLGPFTHRAFQKAIVGGSLVGVACGVIGCFVILRRMAFLGDAVAHAMLAGVTAGYLIMQIFFGSEAHATAMLIGSLIAGMLTVAMVGFVSRVSRIKEDTAIGIMYTGMFAIGGVLHSIFSDRIHIDLYHFVIGTVFAIEDADLWMMACITCFVLCVVILLFRQLQITSFDPVMAASIGVPVLGMNYLLTACTSLVVVGAVQIVGVILVVGLLVTPAASAYLLSDRLTRMLPLSALFAISSVFLGLYAATWIGNIAAGSSIVIVSTMQFLAVLAFAPRYGMVADWWRRRNSVPQQVVEDVLGCFRKEADRPLEVAEVLKQVEYSSDVVHRAVRSLKRSEWLQVDGSTLRLTKSGKREALRLLRAHRLWETYLDHVGVPVDALHHDANRLEHVHDEETVDYLDDKLGHPLIDPHGSEIPEDFEHLILGADVKVSLLREGHQGVVTHLDPEASRLPLQIGMSVLAGPRSDDGRVWTLLLPDKSVVEMDHEMADAVTVRLDRK